VAALLLSLQLKYGRQPDTRAIRDFNDHVRSDQRVDFCLVPIADGVTLARKR